MTMDGRATGRLVGTLLCLLVAACGGDRDDTAPYTPPRLAGTWPQAADPESAGWSSERLREAHRYAGTIDTAALLLVHRGQVVYHWGEVERKFWVHSCRKSFMSALYGVHVERGEIDLSRTLADLGIDDSPSALTDLERTATVQMLLQARSGVYIPAACEAASMAAARPPRFSHAPGTFWYYNNWDFDVLETILQQQTGRGFYQALKEEIADPLGMEDYQVTDGQYSYVPTTMHPCYPVQLTARDMARFGQLYLQRGVWDERRLLSEEWIRESTTSYSDAGSAGGYGYLWWVAVNGRHLPGVALPEGTFSARGAGGHFIVVIPALDVVVVHRVDTFVGTNEVSDAEFGRLLALVLAARM